MTTPDRPARTAGATSGRARRPSCRSIRRRVTVGGGSYSFDLAELDLRLRDLDSRTIDLSITTKLTRDGGALQIPMLLGLRGGALDGRVLHSEPAPAAPSGQAWALDDP